MQEPIKYTEILLPVEETFSRYSFDDLSSTSNKQKRIFPLSLINIFIGENNSGKSQLLRSLFSLVEFDYSQTSNRNFTIHSIRQIIGELNKELVDVLSDGTKVSYKNEETEEKISIDNLFLQDILDKDYNYSLAKIVRIAEQKLEIITSDYISYAPKREGTSKDIYSVAALALNPDKIQKIGEKYISMFKEMPGYLVLKNEKIFYIPILRGMRPFDDQYTNVYRTRTYEDYFKNSGLLENQQIFTGLELYQDLKQKLLGDPEDRDLVKSFEEFLSQKFFNSERVTLVPKEKGNEPKVVNIKIGNEPQFPIYQLGDGLQNLIICIFKIFTEKERCLFFIEEPDMFMHPSFQRAFLEALYEHNQHQYFITSHSNHFLDMTLDFENISVFHFSKEKEFVEGKPNFKVRTTSTCDHRLLFDLGVKNSSVFLSNSTIWVEGIADRFYLRAYMKKYIEELEEDDPNKKIFSSFREDYHYSFVEYQGTNLTHWSFEQNDENSDNILATSICGNVFLIADGDISNKGKGDRAAIYQEMLGDRFYKLPAKEIENFIPEKILQNLPIVIKNFTQKEISLEKIKDENYTNDQQKGIGEYLDILLENSTFATKPDPEKSTTGTGTLKPYYKKKFYEETKKLVDDSTFEWSLTPELTKLCKKIFEHIETHNPRQVSLYRCF